jgi:anti-sigma B factor antagonist
MSVPDDSPTPKRRSTASIETVPIDDRTAVVELQGELDLWSAPQLKRTLCQLLDAGKNRLVLDLAEVRFMDSTALGVLVGIDRRLAGDERLALAEVSREVLRVLEMTGVAAGFRIFPTRDAALTYLTLDQAEQRQSSVPPLTADAALLLGIASTAMPFAQSPAEEAERWLRALRRHGESGAVLASLGVTESPVSRLEERGRAEARRTDDADTVEIVGEHAGLLAAGRGAAKLATTDVLLAVMHVYGEVFDRVLEAHGVQREELAARLEGSDRAEAESAL